MARWWQVVEQRERNEAERLNPQLGFAELSPRLPQDVIIT